MIKSVVNKKSIIYSYKIHKIMVFINYPSRICIMVIAQRLHHDMMRKRESGVNPERCRHCVRELLRSPLGNREGEAVMTEVRRTALAWN